MKCAHTAWLVIQFFALISVVGCGDTSEIVPASGTLTVGGEPLENISVTFMPDVTAGNSGPTSFGTTDANGHFDLTTSHNQPGAVVGPHVVTLVDQDEQRPEQGQAVTRPPRIDSRYSITSSGLEATVEAGEEIELSIAAP
jgi:hypothetical protein